MGPWGPSGPCGPSTPCRPRGPTSPEGPVAPGNPRGPTGIIIQIHQYSNHKVPATDRSLSLTSMMLPSSHNID